MKCTLSLSLATVYNEFLFLFSFHGYIKSLYTRIRASLYISYTVRLMEGVKTAASADQQPLLSCCWVSDAVQEAAPGRWRQTPSTPTQSCEYVGTGHVNINSVLCSLQSLLHYQRRWQVNCCFCHFGQPGLWRAVCADKRSNWRTESRSKSPADMCYMSALFSLSRCDMMYIMDELYWSLAAHQPDY